MRGKSLKNNLMCQIFTVLTIDDNELHGEKADIKLQSTEKMADIGMLLI